jgi:mRNA interferase HigB
MRIIKLTTLLGFGTRHPDAMGPLKSWARTAKEADWKSIQDVRLAFRHADAVAVASGRIATVFNVSGNKYRLITAIHYNSAKVFVLAFLTHAEYDKDAWKERL